MKKVLKALMASPLFEGINEKEAGEIITCFDIRTLNFDRDTFVLRQGEKAKGVGIVITGRIHIIKEDFLGNRDILTEVEPGEIFDEVYAVLDNEAQGISAIATENSQVAFLSMNKIMTVCSNGCQFHNRIIKNMVSVLARKNLMLTRKMEHLSKRTTKEKLISYLSDQATKVGSMTFTIPFNRQQLADYLAVERSALSRELSKLRKEGLLEFYKNQFVLYNVK